MGIPKDVLEFYKGIDERYYCTLLGVKSQEEERLMQLRSEFMAARILDSAVISESPFIRVLPSMDHTDDWQFPPQRIYRLYGGDQQDSLLPGVSVSKDVQLKNIAPSVYSFDSINKGTVVFDISDDGHVRGIYTHVDRLADFGSNILCFGHYTVESYYGLEDSVCEILVVFDKNDRNYFPEEYKLTEYKMFFNDRNGDH